MAGLNGRDGRDSRPVPDPTEKTDALVEKAIKALQALIEARLTEIDKDIAQVQSDIRRRPEVVSAELKHLEGLHDQKFMTVIEQFKTVNVQFDSVQTQFKERDERSRAEKTASDTAVAAALQAQKEAAGEQSKSSKESIDKSETGMLERLKSQEALLATSTKALDDKILGLSKGLDDKIVGIDKRMDRFEGAAIGAATQNVAQQAAKIEDRGGNQMNLSLVMAVVTIGSVVFGIVMAFR